MFKNKWFSRLALVGFFCLMAFTSGGGSAAEPMTRLDKEKKIVDFLMHTPNQVVEGKYAVSRGPHMIYPGVYYVDYDVYEHISPASTRDFTWRSEHHYARVWYFKDDDGKEVAYIFEFVTVHKDEMVSPGYTKIVFSVSDYGIDGERLAGHRDFFICDREKAILAPEFPKGYVNYDWYKPSEAEINAFMDKEFDFWQKVMEGTYNGW